MPINPHMRGDKFYINTDYVIAVYQASYDFRDSPSCPCLVRVEYEDGQVVVEAQSVDEVRKLIWGEV